MPRQSAALLLHRRSAVGPEILLGHPGGPFWARKNEGAWTLPKGELLNPAEPPEQAALREFVEETGFPPPAGPLLPLGTVRLPSGKLIHGFAAEGDCDPAQLRPHLIEIPWPPRSGRHLTIPEIDRCGFFPPDEARRLLHPAQARFIDRLLELLDPAA